MIIRRGTLLQWQKGDKTLTMIFCSDLGLCGGYNQNIVKLAREKLNREDPIILVGTAIYLVVHCLFNIGGVTGLIPLTGVPLLMISSGGSSTLAFMAAIGLAQSVIDQYRRGVIQ